ncbi:hydrogenase formation protein HypD [Symbiobacterium terraclitae]|uniref:hydrogenase formation protein HypD n=1 Tax=Symbiobacterium terraclitae TaxID=557451 RepID=UPI0035B5112C
MSNQLLARPMPEDAPSTAAAWVARIRRKVADAGRTVRLMEFCGTHTVAIARSGLRGMLRGAVELVSGPGCPVCVTADGEIDRMLAYCDVPGAIVATYGDLLRVPGSRTSLAGRRAEGADVRVVYSALDALQLAREAPDRPVIFLGVGFETTAPAAALAVKAASEEGVGNFCLHSAHKQTPAAMRALLRDGGRPGEALTLDGIICPGHVSTVLGAEGFAFLPAEFGIPGAVAGFEPLDILLAVDCLVDAALGRRPVALWNGYRRWVRPEGNRRAQALLSEVFCTCDARWRGLGLLPESGLRLKPEFARFDAEVRFPADVAEPPARSGCRCGDVLRGTLAPADCPLFGAACRPERPMGPCMVSSEGACAAWYRYGTAEEEQP